MTTNRTNGGCDSRRWQRWPAERDDLELPLFETVHGPGVDRTQERQNQMIENSKVVASAGSNLVAAAEALVARTNADGCAQCGAALTPIDALIEGRRLARDDRKLTYRALCPRCAGGRSTPSADTSASARRRRLENAEYELQIGARR